MTDIEKELKKEISFIISTESKIKYLEIKLTKKSKVLYNEIF